MTSSAVTSTTAKWEEEALSKLLYNSKPLRPLKKRAYLNSIERKDVISRQGRQIMELLNSVKLNSMKKAKRWMTSTLQPASLQHTVG